jgi:glycosidase
VRGAGGPALDLSSLRASLSQGERPLGAVPLVALGELEGAPRLVAEASGLPQGKYTLTLEAQATDGRAAAPVRATAFVEPDPDRALDDGLLYEVVVDRFRGPTGALSPPAQPGRRAGGTLDGVRAAIEAGYFGALGVSTLWLSPLYQNPEGTFTGRDGHDYEAYHGYWPAQPRTVEPRFGGEVALEALIQAAHARSLRVIVDVVPNHVYESHPYFAEHSLLDPDVRSAAPAALADWFNDGPDACVCGMAGCPWSERCWFDHYLPDLDWRNPAVLQAGSDDVAWWARRFDLDGVRIDAVPLMPRAAARHIVHALKTEAATAGLDQLVVGENYTGPGEPGRAQMRTYLGETLDGLDSEFDFPLLWTTRDVLGRGTGSLRDLERDVAASAQDFAGSGATLAHLLDNHDTPRFVSVAAGDDAGDPWAQPARQPDDPAPYARQVLALAWMLSLPGLPVLYYGDELGLAGANDPDSRRVMPDALTPASLPPLMARTLERVARLGRARACARALRRGARQVRFLDDDHLVTSHVAGDDAAVLVLSRASDAAALTVSGLPRGRFVDVLGGPPLVVASDLTHLTAGPLRAALYLPESSPCVE